MPRIAILSDIHANLEAFNAVLNKCGQLDIDEYVCLGDIVGYNANPVECLEMARSMTWTAMVRGNHDEYANMNDEAVEGFNPNARAAILWTRAQLSDEERRWVGTTPYKATLPTYNMTLVHATLDSPEQWGYIFDQHHSEDNFTYQFTQVCFCGHSHVPVAFHKRPLSMMGQKQVEDLYDWVQLRDDDGMLIPDDFAQERTFKPIRLQKGYKYLFNIGSIGQPRNRDPRSSFAVYDTDKQTVTRYLVPYDIATAQEKVRAAGLPERLAQRLAIGA